MPKVSKRGIALIQKWEGFFASTYMDPVGVPTIGYGSIHNPDLGIIVRPGMTISRERAVELMTIELDWMTTQVVKLITVPLKQHEFDCIMSFVFNCGVGNLKRSTLLKLINSGQGSQVPDELMKWTKARQRSTNRYVTLPGLVNRRRDEGLMWLNADISNIPPPEVYHAPRVDMAPIDDSGIAKINVTRTIKDVFEPVAGKSGFFSTLFIGAVVTFNYAQQIAQHLYANGLAYTALTAAFVAGAVVGYLWKWVRG